MAHLFNDATVVPWRVVNGEKVITNGYIDSALDIYSEKKQLIFGSCMDGYYVARDRTAKELEDQMDLIDWARVYFIKNTFDVRWGRGGGMVIYDRPILPVSRVRFFRLLKACFKSVPEEKFTKEVFAAKKIAQRQTYTQGHL